MMIPVLNNRKGVTLIELLIVLSIIVILVVAIGSNMKVGSDVWQTENKHTEILQNALIGLDKITRELKQSREIIAVSDSNDPNGNILFRDAKGDMSSFQYRSNGSTSDYLEYSTPNGTDKLAGPIDNLKFICYQADGIIQTTVPTVIRLVKIEMATKDFANTIAVPVSSIVSVGNEERYIFAPRDFAIFGTKGINIVNKDIWVGSHPTRYDPPASIGSIMMGDLNLNEINIYGNIFTKGGMTLSQNSYIGKDVCSGISGKTVVIDSSTVLGDVITNGDVAMINSNVSGIVNHYGTLTFEPNNTNVREAAAGLLDFIFVDPLPVDQTAINPGNSTADDITDDNDIDGDGIVILPLLPGKYKYRDVNVNNKTIRLTVDAANNRYDFNQIVNPNQDVTLDIVGLSDSVGIQIFINGDLNVKNLFMTLDSEPITPTNLLTWSAQKTKIGMIYIESHGSITADGMWLGTFFANGTTPSAGNITLAGTIAGALYSKGIVSLKRSGVNEPDPNAQKVPEINFIPPSKDVLPPIWDDYK